MIKKCFCKENKKKKNFFDCELLKCVEEDNEDNDATNKKEVNEASQIYPDQRCMSTSRA